MSTAIRLIIVDDHSLFRAGVAHMLAAEPDLVVAGQGACAEDAVALAQQLVPDLLLLDLDLPGGGLAVIPAVTAACPAVKIVVLTASIDAEHLMAALRAGAQGYVLKGVSAREVVHILRTVHAGKGYVPPELAMYLLTGSLSVPTSAAQGDPLDQLTKRERQIIDLVAAGLTNKEIAHTLNLTEKTVKYYMNIVLQKLQVRNRVEAAMLVGGNRELHEKSM